MCASESNPTLFAATRWTLVCDAARGGDTGAVEALGTLFGTYWQPLYRYVRRLGRTAQDAEDLVQGFFAHLLQQNGLRLASRDRGRFRAFLLGSLKHYIANEWQRDLRYIRFYAASPTVLCGLPGCRQRLKLTHTEGIRKLKSP